MNIGLACAIFRNILSDDYTDEQKGLAIRTVINMETHNGISKKDMLAVIEYMWNMIYEMRE